MDPRRNPFAPGAGSRPPELAGRDDIIERAEIALDRIRSGLQARSFVFYGLRGVGKTVLLNRLLNDAEARGFSTIMLEAPEGRSLPSQLAPHLRSLFIRLNRAEWAKDKFNRSLHVLASFVKAVKVKYHDVEVGIDATPEAGLADSGELEIDLQDLFRIAGEAAKQSNTAIVIFIDELQYFEEKELAALITAIHHASKKELPITIVAAGLPPLLGKMGLAKSYAERLFEFVPIGPLTLSDAVNALNVPTAARGVRWERDAILYVAEQTERYPYFLQEWGKHAWNAAKQENLITRQDADMATHLALAELDASFFRVRFDRLTLAEKEYLFSLAALGPGTHKSSDVSKKLGRRVSAVASTRDSLIQKGMLYSPAHGDVAFTVPMFDGFLKRNMP